MDQTLSTHRIPPLRKRAFSEPCSMRTVSLPDQKPLRNGLDLTHDDHTTSENTHFTRSKKNTPSPVTTEHPQPLKHASTADVPRWEDNGIAASNGGESLSEASMESGGATDSTAEGENLSTNTVQSEIIGILHVAESRVIKIGKKEKEIKKETEPIISLNLSEPNMDQKAVNSQLVQRHQIRISGSLPSLLDTCLSRLDLDIFQPRCSATTAKKKKCGAKIKETEKNKAFRILRALIIQTNVEELAFVKDFNDVVRLLICNRGAHQKQANSIAARWARILYQPAENPIKIKNIQINFVAEDKKISLRNLKTPTAKKYSHLSLRDHIKTIINKPFKKTDLTEGYVYVYSVNSNFGLVKIGWTKNPPEQRLKQWENQCKRKTYAAYPDPSKELIKIPHAWRVEELVQAELRKYNKWETGCGCRTKTHKEWFETSLPHAIKLVEFWSTWMHTHPYEERPGDWPIVKDTLPQWALTDSHKAKLDNLLKGVGARETEQRKRLQSPPLQRRARSENAIFGSPAQNTRLAARRRELEGGSLSSPVRRPLQGRRAISATHEKSTGLAEDAKLLLSTEFLRSWKDEPIVKDLKKEGAQG